MTVKTYSVILSCCDPPVPVFSMNTNDERRARSVFDALKGSEIHEYQESGAFGGEWHLTLYRHTQQSKVTFMTTTEPHFGEDPFVYYVDYPGSDKLAEMSYMDLFYPDDEETTEIPVWAVLKSMSSISPQRQTSDLSIELHRRGDQGRIVSHGRLLDPVPFDQAVETFNERVACWYKANDMTPSQAVFYTAERSTPSHVQ